MSQKNKIAGFPGCLECYKINPQTIHSDNVKEVKSITLVEPAPSVLHSFRLPEGYCSENHIACALEHVVRSPPHASRLLTVVVSSPFEKYLFLVKPLTN